MAMVESSFDWWQKDVFFSAAEEVQDSADLMESVYREWERERKECFQSGVLEELRRELQTTLGITKWQLEEFEKAVKVSHQKYLAENTIARHRQFVVAIENQISRIEKALHDSLIEEGKQPMRWVQLDDSERDDLALFLSGPARTSQEVKGALDIGLDQTQTAELDTFKGYKETVTINQDSKYVVELAVKDLEPRDKRSSVGESSNGQNELWRSPDIGALQIVVADENMQIEPLDKAQKARQVFDFCGIIRNAEVLTKLSLFKNSFRKAKTEEDMQAKAASTRVLPITRNEVIRNCLGACNRSSNIPYARQLFKRVGGYARHVQVSQYHSSSLQISLIFMLLLFLAVSEFWSTYKCTIPTRFCDLTKKKSPHGSMVKCQKRANGLHLELLAVGLVVQERSVTSTKLEQVPEEAKWM
ncbi:hypothetical protein H6P81_000364 [Aristolochia fimbriata]|uniref:Syntaxin 6/10/61 N-terminal domain-containing protein n=1 Tax=Aristolochia fimbriata TaxID=158543 RepID=A0AAV7F546_ARIFI|nr:hypothetical protein H6P81_000364 [Aristolochia fimbriata]